MTVRVRVYTRLKINGVRQPYKKVNLKKLYADDALFTLGWGGKKPITLPSGTSLEAALVVAKKKELELMTAPATSSAAVVEEARLSLEQAHSAWSERLPKRMKRDGQPVERVHPQNLPELHADILGGLREEVSG
jgi:hypothetical protein